MKPNSNEIGLQSLFTGLNKHLVTSTIWTRLYLSIVKIPEILKVTMSGNDVAPMTFGQIPIRCNSQSRMKAISNGIGKPVGI